MCGFFGIIDYSGTLDIQRSKQALDTLKHRGPDHQKFWTDKKKYFLGHNRLSVIDLSSKANQPYFSSCGNAAIIFNGEIYNYESLKKEIRINYYPKKITDK